MRRYVKTIAFLVIMIVAWEILARLQIYPSYVFPSPSGVLESLREGFADKSFIWGTLTTLKRIAIGFAFAIIAGTTFGFILGQLKIVDETVGPLVLGLQTLPSICWLPVAIVWFGLNENAIIFVVIMGAILGITISTSDGVKNIPPAYIKAAKTMGASGTKLFATVLLPATMPSIITGMKLGWAFAWRSLMAGELLFASGGLGFLLQSGRELNDINRVMAVMIVIIVIGFVVDRVAFSRIEEQLRLKWGLAH